MVAGKFTTIMSMGLASAILIACVEPSTRSASVAVAKSPSIRAPAASHSSPRIVAISRLSRQAIVRQRPIGGARAIVRLTEGTPIQVFGHQGGWTLIRVGSGRGWIPRNAIRVRIPRSVNDDHSILKRPTNVRRKKVPERSSGSALKSADATKATEDPAPRRPERPRAPNSVDVRPCTPGSGCNLKQPGAVLRPGGS